jgi:hypothetical protein
LIIEEKPPMVGDIKRGIEIGKLTQGKEIYVYQKCAGCHKTWWARKRANVTKCRSCCTKKERLYSTKAPIVGEIRYGEEIGKMGEHNTKFIYIECSWCGVRWWTDVYRIPTKCVKCCVKKTRKRDCGKPTVGDIRWGDEIGEGFRAGARHEYRKCEDCGLEWWAGLRNSNPKCLTKCFMCVHEDRRKERACTTCGKVYPTTTEYFAKADKHSLGIRAECITCWKNTMKKSKEKAYLLPGGRLRVSISIAIREALKGKKNGRHWEDLVGYKLKDLKEHLEKQFVDGMSWDNFGKGDGKWHLDHILPQAVFGYVDTSDIDFHRCWALSNLRPMWGRENMRKHAKVIKPFQPSWDMILNGKTISKNVVIHY